MARARTILRWVYEEDAAAAETVDTDDQYDLAQGSGYRYQDRGEVDPVADTSTSDGTKPSGMTVEDYSLPY